MHRTVIAVLLLLLPIAVAAQVMVLIPGYQGQQYHPFREAGVTIPLAASG